MDKFEGEKYMSTLFALFLFLLAILAVFGFFFVGIAIPA